MTDAERPAIRSTSRPPSGSVCGEDPAELIDDDAGAARCFAVRIEDAHQPARTDRGGGECTLGLQCALECPALGARAKREHRLRHRDERHPVGDGQQWHPDGVGGGDEPLRRGLMRQFGAEAQPDRPHSCAVKLLHVGATACGAVGEQQPDGQQQLTALQPGAGTGQLGDRGRLDLSAIRPDARDQLESEGGIVE